MYPELPNAEQLATMTAAELRTLALQIRQARKAEFAASPRMSADEHTAWLEWGDVAGNLTSLAQEADAEELDGAAADAAERARQALAEAGPEEGDDGDAGGDDAGDDGDEGGADDGGAGGELATVGGGRVSTDLSLGSQRRTVQPSGTGWVSTGVGDKARGEAFESSRELGEIVQAKMAQIADGDNQKLTLATMPANFADHQRLDGDQLFVDLARLSDPDEIEAAFCTPLTPLYALACANVTRRPVFNGLPQFTIGVDRGGVRVPESPSLTDITGGFGQWTSANDADTNAIKNACQTIDCVNWNDFEWYATYRCLKVKNMANMVFPELTEAYLNRLQARWARYAEVLLLEQMGNASTQIDAPRQSYGANVSLQRVILTYLGLYQEIERWDVPVMDAWMPRWLLWALRMDIASRRKDGSGRVPSIAEVESTFTEVGVMPHWYMDRPTWATPVPNLATSGDLNFFPSTAEILVHRRGKFAVIDKGVLNLGLGGNPIRIEDDVRRNQSTFFFESFEGLVDTDSCPAHILTVPGLCYNGFQIADKNIACEGYDMVGVGSN